MSLTRVNTDLPCAWVTQPDFLSSETFSAGGSQNQGCRTLVDVIMPLIERQVARRGPNGRRVSQRRR